MRYVGIESRKSYQRKLDSGFIRTYLGGSKILELGYKGDDPKALPIVEGAIGIDLDYPGYDGIHLPFADGSQDAVYSSHCLEHISDYRNALSDWFRVLKTGGYLVIAVPHQYLYEKKAALPSLWNGDHKRFYTPARLLAEIEESLPVNSYRVRHLMDNDADFDYRIPPSQHSAGCYEIEVVLQKIERPPYSDELRPAPAAPAPPAPPPPDKVQDEVDIALRQLGKVLVRVKRLLGR